LRPALLFSVFVIAACGLVYELVAGALSSYLLGDSVTQFSTVIGTYLFAMGVGSFASRLVERNLIARFIEVEIGVGLLGGFSAGILFLVFTNAAPFRLILYALVFLVGALVGLEIPLVMRILRQEVDFTALISEVLGIDYLGALLVSLLFPLILAPHLGMIRTSLLFGAMNVLVALATAHLFRARLPQAGALMALGAGALVALVAGMVLADRLTQLGEESYYNEEIVHARTTPYQRIVLTRWQDDVRLYLNGNLQFSARDEYRYHEALIHPGLASLAHPRRVLVLGGGDGLAVREILRYPTVESVTLVELDPAMTELFRNHPMLTALNQDALSAPRVHVVQGDAFQWLERDQGYYDFIVVDFPDPGNYAVGKLYTTAFYRLVKAHLSAHGAVVVQSTSPLYARRSFWSIAQTVAAVGLTVSPYHAYVPSFGEWGYLLATPGPYHLPEQFPAGLRFLTREIAQGLFLFPADMARVDAAVNRLDNQILVHYYNAEWREAAP
jgi:spermidine synthase